jgi:hypothetical protein
VIRITVKLPPIKCGLLLDVIKLFLHTIKTLKFKNAREVRIKSIPCLDYNLRIVWGTTYLAIRIGVTDLPPMLFAGLRWIIAGVLMTIL